MCKTIVWSQRKTACPHGVLLLSGLLQVLYVDVLLHQQVTAFSSSMSIVLIIFPKLALLVLNSMHFSVTFLPEGSNFSKFVNYDLIRQNSDHIG